MLLGKVTGTVTATLKAERLTGQVLLIVDRVEAGGAVLEPGLVAADTVGAGLGDLVLITQGSAARMAEGLSGAPVDLAIVGIVDRLSP